MWVEQAQGSGCGEPVRQHAPSISRVSSDTVVALQSCVFHSLLEWHSRGAVATQVHPGFVCALWFFVVTSYMMLYIALN